MDRVSPSRRSEMMRRVHSKDTEVELRVRKFIYSLGFRYRLHAKDLPGSPDIVFRRSKKVIFVHGCFWHAHGCKKGQLPKSKLDFWQPKLQTNVERDVRVIRELKLAGWRVLVIWQCEVGDLSALRSKIEAFLL
ncbi:very short patch repair endonuclease [Paraburkholderia tropica]|uniref:very short patch repair endonuclease n=1 Tax=Paraburkholderia tropica TaxID=92647 RepID=UPI0009426674|nr:DNA mismatch endonuclease Vsr [Paraburkholderia tropica]RQN40796.1 DNA mismatch endonuclease Vsr [Paraburkholderia tropica]